MMKESTTMIIIIKVIIRVTGQHCAALSQQRRVADSMVMLGAFSHASGRKVQTKLQTKLLVFQEATRQYHRQCCIYNIQAMIEQLLAQWTLGKSSGDNNS